MQYNKDCLYRFYDNIDTAFVSIIGKANAFMLKKDFWYDLPKELIAQEPADPRDSARLMVLSQKDDSIQHRIFHDLPEYLEPGDLLVVNNSKVLPARIVGVKQPTGAVCELLLLRQVKGDQWECLAKPGKRMQPGTKVSFGDGTLTAVVDETMEDGNKYVTFYYDTETLYEKLDEFGKMPLPPYITKQLEDQSQYQTVYAKELGSAAAPTAGLHFTPELMDTIRAKGVGIAEVTLHVGLGTFRPVMEDEIADHKMHSEWYSISEETAQRIRETKAAGHRVIAVGTTSCRTLEAVAAKYGEIKACSGNTSIFLYPGVKFNCIDGLITNFHLPESTLIMLVSALYGYEKTMAAYKVAVEKRYRFFSFGDAMLMIISAHCRPPCGTGSTAVFRAQKGNVYAFFDDLQAPQAGAQCPAGRVQNRARHGADPGIPECSHGRRDQGRPLRTGSAGDRHPGNALQHLPSASPPGR